MNIIERFIYNWKYVNMVVGEKSFTITVDCGENEEIPSESGSCYMVRHDFAHTESGHNCVIYANRIMNALNDISVGGGNEEDKKTALTEWVKKNPNKPTFLCPIKLYYPSCASNNLGIKDILFNQFKMFVEPHYAVIHLVRDATRDKYEGGYFAQMHFYSNGNATMYPDTELDKLAKRELKAALLSMNLGCKVKVLTNPSIFGRVFDWLTRCYFRFNTVVYRTTMNIFWAIAGKEIGTRDNN